MIETTVTMDELRELLKYDPNTGIFTWSKSRPKTRIGQIAGSKHHKGYVHIEIFGKQYMAHRLAWFYMTGAWPKEQIDHIDLDRSNNRWFNLREATGSQNQANRPRKSTNKCGLKGVRFSRLQPLRPWIAQICKDGRVIYLGSFCTKEDAHKAYCKAAYLYHGRYANTG